MRMVNIHDFRVMPFEKKCDVVTYYGQYLAYRFLGDCKVFCMVPMISLLKYFIHRNIKKY